jgi:hypothetical protein
MPNSIEDYVHRIGRTGRAGQTGEAYAFFTPKNARMANDLAKYLVEACQVGHRLTPSTAFPARVVNRISHFLFAGCSPRARAAAWRRRRLRIWGPSWWWWWWWWSWEVVMSSDTLARAVTRLVERCPPAPLGVPHLSILPLLLSQ